jgi:hypothetical protein
LDSGDILIVNGYQGGRRSANVGDPYKEFTGEIVQVDGDFAKAGNPPASPYGFDPTKRNLGFNSLSIKFELPPVNGARGIILPTFADRR